MAKLQAASVPIVNGSCAPGLGQTNGRIAVSFNAILRRVRSSRCLVSLLSSLCSVKFSIVLCYNINKLTYLLTSGVLPVVKFAQVDLGRNHAGI